MEVIKDREDHVLERDSLKEVVRRLRADAEHELFQEGAMPILSEENDPVDDLVSSGFSADEYIKQANTLFTVRESKAPASLRKHRFVEGFNGEQVIPCVAQAPGTNRGLREVDERAMDMYVKHWNTRQSMNGDPLRISWSPSPNRLGAISFSAEVK